MKSLRAPTKAPLNLLVRSPKDGNLVLRGWECFNMEEGGGRCEKLVGTYESYPIKIHLHLGGFILIPNRIWWMSGVHGKWPLLLHKIGHVSNTCMLTASWYWLRCHLLHWVGCKLIIIHEFDPRTCWLACQIKSMFVAMCIGRCGLHRYGWVMIGIQMLSSMSQWECWIFKSQS